MSNPWVYQTYRMPVKGRFKPDDDETSRVTRDAMQLSAEMFEAIVKNLKGSAPEGRDKRREPRAGLCGKADMIPISLDQRVAKSCLVRVRDLSPRGIGLVHNKRLGVDTQFAIQLPCGNNARITVVYTVRHCKTLSPDLFSIGGLLRELPGRPAARGKKAALPAEVVAG
jgi:hypothetical protein